jgi:hypothetical protein
MTTTTTTSALVPEYLDVTRLTVASFLARYREPTLTAYTQDLKAYLGWCQTYDRDVLAARRRCRPRRRGDGPGRADGGGSVIQRG